MKRRVNEDLQNGIGGRRWAGLCLILLTWALTCPVPSVEASPPQHTRDSGLDITELNHACGAAVDSQGDIYVASAGEGDVKVFSPTHVELAAIANVNEPCGLAVDGGGDLYVSEQATGEVVKYTPDAYPLSGSPIYGARTVIDSSGNAGGIAIDPHDERLYVAEGDHIAQYGPGDNLEAELGAGDLTDATGVAVYSYPLAPLTESGTRYVFVADKAGAEPDTVKVFAGSFNGEAPEPTIFGPLKLRRSITGVDQDRNPATPPEAIGFGTRGAYIAVDPGNRNDEAKCTSVAEQACTAGHFLVYDAAHKAVDEFDAGGEFLDQIVGPALVDGEPTAMAVDRSGGVGDGTIYVSAGASSEARLFAFNPLVQPARAELPERSHVLANARGVATDRFGDVYAAAGPFIHVYRPNGTELTRTEGSEQVPLIEDTNAPLEDLTVDSEGHVYVLEDEKQISYYSPSAFPPAAGTTYAPHGQPVATEADFGFHPLAITSNPGPSAGKDHLFVTDGALTHEYDSAVNGSALLDGEFAQALPGCNGVKRSIGVDGSSGAVYFGEFSKRICIVDASGDEVLTSINGAGSPGGLLPTEPKISVDQSNGHVLVFSNPVGAAREYDASGAFVAEFGHFTTSIVRSERIAVDNSCALHNPPLTEATTPTCAEFDPAGGDIYVAFDDTKAKTPDVWAFDRLQYGESPLAANGAASGIGGGAATLNGAVNPRGFDLSECKFEYLAGSEYEANGKTFSGATSVSCVPGVAEIGRGSNPVPVHAQVSGLDTQERYLFRLVASNKYGTSTAEPPSLFGLPRVVAKQAQSVLYDEATLRAQIDPSGLPTSYHFEYGTQAGALSQSTPTEGLSGSLGPTEVGFPLTGLQEGTNYYFRVVAENEAGVVPGTEETFATRVRQPLEACSNAEYRFGLSAHLPDCRAYELVTPAETNGLVPYAAGNGSSPGTGFNDWLATPRGPGAGETFSYFTDGTLAGFEGDGRFDGYRAHRGAGEHPAGGWSSELFSPSFSQAGNSTPDQRGTSTDQRYSFWRSTPKTMFEGTLPSGTYLRSPSGSTTAACNPVLSQNAFEFVGCGDQGTDPDAANLYVSAGGTHVIFASSKHLEPEAAPEGTMTIYDRAAGHSNAAVVSLAPGGSSFGGGESAAYVGSNEGGNAVLFRVGGTLYLHREGQTLQVATAPNTFAGVSTDGSRVFYATGPGNTPAGLFTCDVQVGTCAGAGKQEIVANGIFVNVSADGSHALFTSEESLTGTEENEIGETAKAGEHNLYTWNGGGIAFVGILDPQDFVSFGGIPNMNLQRWTTAINPGATMGWALAPARSTPDGSVFVFQSHARLTSYENEEFGEIYRYDPSAPAGKILTCVSCDPGGAPPTGDALLEDVHSATGITSETVIPNVTDDGDRVFFQSPDHLLPEDANEVADVYEWKAGDAVGCSLLEGCLGLISSGQGESPSYLYAMSADGHDVFFRTVEALVGTDVAGTTSIYDAREQGGILETIAAEGCKGDACQGSGTPPPILPSPASEGGGAGNAPSKKSACGRGRHRRHGRCVKRHQKSHPGKRRGSKAGKGSKR
jgi:hypothetical protein